MSVWRQRRFWRFLTGVLLVFSLGLGVYFLFFWKTIGPTKEWTKNSFDGSSEGLGETVVVPTLDTPIPINKSAIWCSSFQLAWNHLRTDVGGGPIRLTNAQPLADALNQADQTEADLDARDFCATAGAVKDGIIQRIQSEMANRFPGVSIPAFDVPADGFVAYGYMRSQVKFATPFFENEDKFEFTNGTGSRVAVKSFGIRAKDDYAYQQLRKQVDVLYCPREVLWSEKEGGEYIVDPCKYSQPYQIILACLNRKPTLAEGIADVESKAGLTQWPQLASGLGPRDTLLIPNMHWQVSHRFKELEGKDKQFLNPPMLGTYLDTAFQMIQFRLDRSGAEIASESKVYVVPGATFFHFNRPFLVIVKKREAKHPCFVMWVDNAELLDK